MLHATTVERLGLDLVTIQDHPYQAAFYDTWTLLTYLAGRTERITFVPTVATLPLRPPAVLAKSAATLDLLTGGRVQLGLGAGAFWDAIVAMGGPRRVSSGGGGGAGGGDRRDPRDVERRALGPRRRHPLPGGRRASGSTAGRRGWASGSARTGRGCSP